MAGEPPHQGVIQVMNKVIILGRLGADPELRDAGQTKVTNLSLATTEKWTDKSGEKQERTEWHRVVVWGKQAENCARYLSKGSMALVEGKLQTRSWEKDGEKKYATDIVAEVVRFVGGGGQKKGEAGVGFSPEPGFDSSEEIPF